ncbi:MAG: acyl-CoA carboxylase subunit beta [Candidatus Pacebacteria bacterium]|jgi:acetyl-CoA carboxylase carboxyltransferase component|nr:acyl-CoA carboxylase subunit beta [Candidatus Paceibacterota bacterium]
MNFEKEIEQLNKIMSGLESPELVEKQHQKGKLSARERIFTLLDPDTFTETDQFVETRFDRLGLGKKKAAGDAVVTGFGKISNRPVCVFSQDFTKVGGGSLGEMHGKKIVKTIEMARATGCPVIGIIDSGGARIQEGVSSLDGYAGIFAAMVKASGVVPQISVILGPSAGGACYAPGLSDFIFMVDNISQMFITGPEVIKKVTGEEVTFENLGGANVHCAKSGCSQFRFANEKDCLAGVKKLLSYLPQNNMDDAPRSKSLLAELFEKEDSQKLMDIVPEESGKGYDIKAVIEEIFDNNSFFEVHGEFATNIVTGFARLGGYAAGVVANQPKFMAGVLDIDSSDKLSRFVRFCDSFNIPIINLVDTSGYLPGTNQEHNGIIRHGAKVLYAYAEASVPKISLILRKAFGGAYIAMASRELGYDRVLAWPGAQIAVMGPEQAVRIIYHRELAERNDAPKFEQEKIEEIKQMNSAFEAAKLGQVDMVINPKDTRAILTKLLESLLNKREEKINRKHGNTPL